MKTEEVKEVQEVQEQIDIENLTQEQALNILVNSVKVATKRGAYEIEETEIILKAIKVFTQPK